MAAFLLAVLGLALVLTACGSTGPASPSGDHGRPGTGRLRVVATLYPLAFLAAAVGGDRVQVDTLVPVGAEAPHWEPRPADVAAVADAHVFIYNGAGLEPWARRLVDAAGNGPLVLVEATAGLKLLSAGTSVVDPLAAAPEAEGTSGGESHGEAHHHGPAVGDGAGVDPHVWLDPVLAQDLVRRIAQGLIQADPAGRQTLEQRAADVIGRLQDLATRYDGLARCPRRELVISHGFFTYPAHRYGIVQIPIFGSVSPDAEPTPRRMSSLAQFLRQRGIRHILAEPGTAQRSVRALADEVGAQVLVLHPLESLTPADQAQGLDYWAWMERNLAAVQRALGCRPAGQADGGR